jgi:hypothetical protein
MSGLKLIAFTCGLFQSTKSFFISGDGDEIVKSPIPAYLIDHPKGLAVRHRTQPAVSPPGGGRARGRQTGLHH